jgi:gliding motility-associated-like protein
MVKIPKTYVNGCTSTNSITITEPTALGSSETLQNVLCNNGTNGSIILNITGGTSGYNFIWNNSATSQNLTGLTSGAYQVTVTDANGCTISNNYTITQPSVISSTTLNVSNATCLIPGSVDISVNGGVGNYTYLWSNTSTTQNLTGLSGGSFTVTITDQNGCSLVNGPNVVISIGTPVASLTSTSNISCNGRNDGSIDITVSGGSPNYTYNWSNGATSEDLLNITAGTYSITVLDNLGCIANVSSIVISEPSALSITDNFSDVTCNGYNNGTVSLNVLGGVPTYNYIWTNGSTTQNLSGLGIGIYAATITDANGCLLTRGPFNITEPTAVSIFNIQAINPTCGSNNGSIDIAVGGGIPNYSYQWSNGQTNQNITTVPGGNYTVTVTDSDGCFAISNLIVLNNSADIILDIVNINESCNQPGSGAVNLVLNGGTPPFNFIWNNGSTTENLTNVASGSYSVTVTDALGCDDIDSVVVTSPLQPTVDAVFLPSLTTDTIISFGEIVNISAGTNQAGVNYLWTSTGPGNMNFGSNNSNQTDINPEFDGDYLIILTATSTDGCISIDSLNIQVLPNNPEIPTAFSPNGDGNNDIFQVVNLDKTLVQEFKIYNRWGQLIYDDKIQAAWDGKYKGVPQPRDVYMFVISWKTTSGEVDVVKRGNVTLMR